MIPLGLSAADRRRFEATLTQTHRIRVRARIHDRDEKIISTIPSRILSGAVQYDMSQAPWRTLELTLLEPRRAPAWLPDAPSDAAAFANNFVSVRYGVWVPDLSGGPDWVDVPVFWGPMVGGIDADGETVTIHAVGKEALALDPHLLWDPLKLRKGRRRTAAIRDVLEAYGEARFDMPQLASKLRKEMQLGRHAQGWRVVKAIAGGMDKQVFYDGRGRVRVRAHPENRVWTFHDAADGSILTRPTLSYSIDGARNLVEVLGPEPKGPPKRIRAVAKADKRNKLSPASLSRNGVPRRMVHVVDSNLAKPEMEWHGTDEHLIQFQGYWGAPSGVKHPKRWFEHRHSIIVHRQDKAEEIAERQLAHRLRATVDITAEVLPIPHLEEGDVVGFRINEMHYEVTARQWTLPLTSDSSMSFGTNKRIPMRHRKKHHKNKHHHFPIGTGRSI